MSGFRRLLHTTRDDSGYALLVVLGIGVLLLTVVASALTVASSGYVKARTDDRWNAALSAAYGGLDEYRSRLANDSTYIEYGNPASDFSSSTGSMVSLPPEENLAFGVGDDGTWASIPGADDTVGFRYALDNAEYAASGTLRLQVTGRAGGETRTIVADLRQKGFLDYLYFTDFEVEDPAISGKPLTCAAYLWATPPRPSDCAPIFFGPMDVINGPLHSNDVLLLCGGTFNGAVTTGNPFAPHFYKPGGCPDATFASGSGPEYSTTIVMPETNAELKKETRNDLPDVPRPGCLYTGPTSITFNSDGTMTVLSPWSKYTNVSYTNGVPPANPPACGLPGPAAGQLGHKHGATVPVLEGNVAYVQNVPAVATDWNYWPASGTDSLPADFQCLNPDTEFPGWLFHSAGYPRSGEVKPDGTGAVNPAYGCRNGDVFVKGDFNGATTVAAENYIYIVDDLRYVDMQRDLLGLVGQNAVWIYNPQNAAGNSMNTETNRVVHAAIISVAHTFTVQNYKHGPSRGTLTVYGAIAQNFRGPVATMNAGSLTSGYAKNYVYDNRFRYTSPPKFLTPVSTTYRVNQVSGVPTAYTADGGTP